MTGSDPDPRQAAGVDGRRPRRRDDRRRQRRPGCISTRSTSASTTPTSACSSSRTSTSATRSPTTSGRATARPAARAAEPRPARPRHRLPARQVPARVRATRAVPGDLVFTDVYIHSIGIGIGLNPTTIEGEIIVGAIPIAPPDTYTVTVTGTVKLQIGDSSHPTVFFVGGQRRDPRLRSRRRRRSPTTPTATCCSTSGSTTAATRSRRRSAPSGDMFVLHGDFGADLDAHGCLVDLCGGLKAGASSKGIAVCDSDEDAGADLTFSPFSVDIHPTSCHISDFAIAPPPPGARAADASVHVADVHRRHGPDRRRPQDRRGRRRAERRARRPDGSDGHAAAADRQGRGRRRRVRPDAGRDRHRGRPAQAGGRDVDDQDQPRLAGIAQLSIAHDVALPKIKARVSAAAPRASCATPSPASSAGTTVAFAEKTSGGFAGASARPRAPAAR